MLFKPRDLERSGLLESLAVDAVVGDAFDDVVFRRHAAGGNLLLRLGDDVVVAQLLVLRDDEKRGHLDPGGGFESAEADALGRVGPHVGVFLHLASHLSCLERHRLHLAAGLLGVEAERGGEGAITIRTAETRHLRDDAFHAGIRARHVGHESATVAAAHEADALRVHRRLAREEADRGANVLGLVGVVHLPAQRLHLDRQLALLVRLRLWLGGHELALALTPAAIVERQRDIPFLRKDRPEAAARATLGAARSRAKDDRGQFLAFLAVLRQIEIARHARAITPDRHGAFFDGVRESAARGGLVRVGRARSGGSRSRCGCWRGCRLRGRSRRRALRLAFGFGKLSRYLRDRADTVLVSVDLVKELRHLLAGDLAVAVAVDLFEPFGDGGVLGADARGKEEKGECRKFHGVDELGC